MNAVGRALERRALEQQIKTNRAERERLVDELNANKLAFIEIARGAQERQVISVRTVAKLAGMSRIRLHEWLRGENVGAVPGRPRHNVEDIEC